MIMSLKSVGEQTLYRPAAPSASSQLSSEPAETSPSPDSSQQQQEQRALLADETPTLAEAPSEAADEDSLIARMRDIVEGNVGAPLGASDDRPPAAGRHDNQPQDQQRRPSKHSRGHCRRHHHHNHNHNHNHQHQHQSGHQHQHGHHQHQHQHQHRASVGTVSSQSSGAKQQQQRLGRDPSEQNKRPEQVHAGSSQADNKENRAETSKSSVSSVSSGFGETAAKKAGCPHQQQEMAPKLISGQHQDQQVQQHQSNEPANSQDQAHPEHQHGHHHHHFHAGHQHHHHGHHHHHHGHHGHHHHHQQQQHPHHGHHGHHHHRHRSHKKRLLDGEDGVTATDAAGGAADEVPATAIEATNPNTSDLAAPNDKRPLGDSSNIQDQAGQHRHCLAGRSPNSASKQTSATNDSHHHNHNHHHHHHHHQHQHQRKLHHHHGHHNHHQHLLHQHQHARLSEQAAKLEQADDSLSGAQPDGDHETPTKRDPGEPDGQQQQQHPRRQHNHNHHHHHHHHHHRHPARQRASSKVGTREPADEQSCQKAKPMEPDNGSKARLGQAEPKLDGSSGDVVMMEMSPNREPNAAAAVATATTREASSDLAESRPQKFAGSTTASITTTTTTGAPTCEPQSSETRATQQATSANSISDGSEHQFRRDDPNQLSVKSAADSGSQPAMAPAKNAEPAQQSTGQQGGTQASQQVQPSSSDSSTGLTKRQGQQQQQQQQSGGGGSRDSQQRSSASIQQQPQFATNGRQLQVAESNYPPDRRRRLCWCCCCPCASLTSKSHTNKNGQRSAADQTVSSDKSCSSAPNASFEEVRSWSESFDKLMKCPEGRKVFQDFLRCEYSEENILFWIACEELKNEKDLARIATKARDIYEDYISILSAKEVSLDSRVRDVINTNIKKPTPNIFDEAQLQIYTLMHRDSYPRFLNSTMYKRLAGLQA